MVFLEIIGLSQEKIKQISEIKKEDSWVLDYRLKSYELFEKAEEPSFGPKANIDFEKVIYYKTNDDNKIKNNWNDISCSIRDELNSVGVLESEKHLDGMGVQYESEVIYHNMLDELTKKNVIFTSIEEGLKKYPDIARKYFGKIVSNADNKYASLNSSVFSGGSFIYIPPHTELDRPLQSYFRINSRSMGQFERTFPRPP